MVIHCREAVDEDTADVLAPFRGTVVLHCFSEPELLPVALERGYYVSFAGNVTYNRAEDLRAAAREVPAERLLVETDSPYLAPQPLRGRPNEPANVVHTVAALAAARGEDAEVLGRQTPRTRPCGLPPPMSRLPDAKRHFGQHFLVDENVLGVIGRLAELDADDVVLEIGPGAGILTAFLAERVRLVHAVEIDRSLEERLRHARRVRRTSGSSSATHSGSTLPSSTRRRGSSSPTCPTTSPRRWWSRAWTACRPSTAGRSWCSSRSRSASSRGRRRRSTAPCPC